MESMTPEGKNPQEYFAKPQTLVDELLAFERFNYYLIETCELLEGCMNGRSSAMGKQLDEMNDEIENRREKITKWQEEENNLEQKHYDFAGMKKSEDLDGELAELSGKIRETHFHCFDRQSDRNLFFLLEELENGLREYDTKLNLVDPAFIKEKQAAKDKHRREEQRLINIKKREQERQKKMQEALRRANKPIPKKTSRPVIVPTFPLRKKKKDDKYLNELEEQRRIDHLLYGPLCESE